MEVRGTETGSLPELKTIEKSGVPGREGLHLLGQSLRSANPLFAALFGFGSHARVERFHSQPNYEYYNTPYRAVAQK